MFPVPKGEGVVKKPEDPQVPTQQQQVPELADKCKPEAAKNRSSGNVFCKSQDQLFRLNMSLQKVIQTKGKQVCYNATCGIRADELVSAPSHALCYFGVSPGSARNSWRICEKCLQEAEEFKRRSMKAVKDKENMFSASFKVQPSYMDLEDDEGPGKDKEKDVLKLKDGASVNGLHPAEDMYSISTSVLDKELASIMGRMNIKEQINKCKATVEGEVDMLSAEFASLEGTMSEASTQIVQVLGQFNSLVDGTVKLEVESVDICDSDTYTTREPRQLGTGKRLESLYVKQEEDKLNSGSFCTSYQAELKLNQLDQTKAKERLKLNNALRNAPLSKPSPTDSEQTRERPRGGFGMLLFAPPKVNQKVYAMNEDLLTCWHSANIIQLDDDAGKKIYKVQLTYNNSVKRLMGSQIAFAKPAVGIQLPVGTRVIARFNDVLGNNPATHGKYFAGIIGECPCRANYNRYLIFFDDGYSQYVSGDRVLPVVETSGSDKLSVVEMVHENTRAFIQGYLSNYPNCRLLPTRVGDVLEVELYGDWLKARVVDLDCSLMKVCYLKTKGSYEWIFRGSLRLGPLFFNNPSQVEESQCAVERIEQNPLGVDIRPITQEDPVKKENSWESKINRLMNYETDGVMTKIHIPPGSPTPKKYVHHSCSPACAFKYEEEPFRKVSPLVIPFYLGWARELSRLASSVVAYISPCGIRMSSYDLIHAYICITRTEIPIEFFSLEAGIDCLNVFKPSRELEFLKDISYGKEWTPVQCINSIDRYTPDPIEYCSTSVMVDTNAKIGDENFLVCCDCTDDCKDKEKCACSKLTLAGISCVQSAGKLKGYENRRLPEMVGSGIYECNKRCKCNVRTCFNRVVQNKVKWPVQIFKTIKKGWGVRALHDTPKGSFICVYTGRVLNYAEADAEGRLYGDEYLADLDFIEVMEGIKEGYEEDCIEISDDESKGGKKVISDGLKGKSEAKKYTPMAQRQVARKSTSGGYRQTDKNGISNSQNSSMNDSSVSPKSLHPKAKAGMKVKPLPYRKYFKNFSGKKEDAYSIDGKRFGNFGRYFNHSCDPNLFIQSIFVDTHDLRFPWVAFFTNRDVKAGTELCWDYKYEPGSVSNKVLYCYCEAANCRRRLL